MSAEVWSCRFATSTSPVPPAGTGKTVVKSQVENSSAEKRTVKGRRVKG